MDSLTQIVLGAAAGEVVLGKKLGNRAMIWGAVGGTIPDLDVLGKFFLSSIDNLAFHRGISHSIFFSIVGAFIIGWLVNWMYNSRHHKWIASFCRALATILVGFVIDMFLKMLFPGTIIPTLVMIPLMGFILYKSCKGRYFEDRWEKPEASVREWQWLFFWSLFTHPILDCFTMYGTQLFAPFSDKRVAWSSIAVADLFYTVPFIICLFIASRLHRSLPKRRFWNYLGLGLSSAYLIFTLFHKQKMNNTFAAALHKEQIDAERFVTNAYLFTNFLWTCTAETEDYFYQGLYSVFDTKEISFTAIEKKHDLISNIDTDYTIKTLRWFCDDYFSVFRRADGRLQFNDLRFGSFSGEVKGGDDFIFKFFLKEQGETYEMEEAIGGPPEGGEKEVMKTLWTRIWGI